MPPDLAGAGGGAAHAGALPRRPSHSDSAHAVPSHQRGLPDPPGSGYHPSGAGLPVIPITSSPIRIGVPLRCWFRPAGFCRVDAHRRRCRGFQEPEGVAEFCCLYQNCSGPLDQSEYLPFRTRIVTVELTVKYDRF